MMLNRPMSRLATAVAAAGTVCALGAATAAAAAPTAPRSWSGPKGPVPHAFSNATPGLTRIFLTGTGKNGTLVAWKGKFDDRIHYETRIGGHWSAAQTIPGAATSAGPAVGFYPDPTGHDAVLAVWKKLGSSRILYAQGQTHSSGAISWAAPATLPGSLTRTSTAPAVLFPANAPHDRVIVAWKGPDDHVRYSVGTPAGRGFTWTSSDWLSSALTTKTGAAPALAEVQTGTAKGTLQVFWKGYRSYQVRYVTTADPLKLSRSHLTWSRATVVPHAATGAGPAVCALGVHGAGPLLLAYKAPRSLQVRYQTLHTGWSARRTVPGASTAVGPALLGGLLATTASDTSGSIFFRYFS
jgi:hypothetical protein